MNRHRHQIDREAAVAAMDGYAAAVNEGRFEAASVERERLAEQGLGLFFWPGLSSRTRPVADEARSEVAAR